MYLNLNIILIILAYQCLTICSLETEESLEETIIPKESGFIIKFHPPNKTDVSQEESRKADTSNGHEYENHMESVTEKERPDPKGTDVSNGHEYENYMESITEKERPDPKGTVHEDCKFHVPYEDYNMPIPLTNSSNPKVLYPDKNRIIHIKQFSWFRMVCAGSKFLYPLKFNKSELLLRCLGKDLFEYNGRTYNWPKLRCGSIPKPTAVLTKKKCLHKYSVVKVGFNTENGFVTTYNACFDMWTKNTLFAWYSVKTPHYDIRQTSYIRPEYIKSPLFGEVDLDDCYKKQSSIVEKILKSRLVTRRYIRKGDGEHFLDKGHLISHSDFNYVFEQDATFFYENSCPQWRLFMDGIWNDVERLFRRNLAKASNGNHVVIAGTYGVDTLPDTFRAQQPLVLFQPQSLLVPLFIWKMDYDLETQTGIVFLAMNDLYKPINKDVYICETVTCPGKMIRRIKTRSVHYCCTTEGFEKVFGRFDAHLFKVAS